MRPEDLMNLIYSVKWCCFAAEGCYSLTLLLIVVIAFTRV